jgi:DNA-binding FrmR family transcriptional regulator
MPAGVTQGHKHAAATPSSNKQADKMPKRLRTTQAHFGAAEMQDRGACRVRSSPGHINALVSALNQDCSCTELCKMMMQEVVL